MRRHRTGWRRRRQALLTGLLALCLFLPAEAKAQDAARYDECLRKVEQAPEEGLTEALQWRDLGGGAPARHCVAMGLAATGHEDMAAARLEELAAEVGSHDRVIAADLMAQGAALWSITGQDPRALAALDKAIGWNGDKATLHLDRAHVLSGMERFREADEAVTRALELDDLSAEAYALRGMIRRELNQRDSAEDDIAMALALDPEQPYALIQRALQRAAAGDRQGARDDANAVIAQDPDAPVAENARRVLEAMDVRP